MIESIKSKYRSKNYCYWLRLLSQIDGQFKVRAARCRLCRLCGWCVGLTDRVCSLQGAGLQKFVENESLTELRAATVQFEGYLQTAIDMWTRYAASNRELSDNQILALTGLEFTVYKQMAEMLALSGIIRKIAVIESTADQMFWYRFFDMSASAVPLDKLAKALRVHLIVECGIHNMVDEARWAKMVTTAVGTSHFVSDDDFVLFAKRFGPLKSTFDKVKGVCGVTGEAAEWFLRDATKDDTDTYFKLRGNRDQKQLAVRLYVGVAFLFIPTLCVCC